MKTYESGILRPFGSLVHGLVVIALLLGGLLSFVMLCEHVSPGAPKSDHLLHALKNPGFILGSGLVGLIGLPITWSSFVRSRGSYRLGGTELEIRSGWLGRNLQSLPLTEITKIDLSSGPLMRLTGRDDLMIQGAGCFGKLHGVKDGEALRTLLLERRDSLRDLKAEEDAARNRDSRDAVLARLTKILERLEAKA